MHIEDNYNVPEQNSLALPFQMYLASSGIFADTPRLLHNDLQLHKKIKINLIVETSLKS
jgi:hypothetical protein